MEGNPGRAPRLVGVVVNCLDLTIRKSPGNEAEVTGHLSVLTEVLVVFSILTQMGVGPANGFSIMGKDEGWSDFISGGAVLPLVKSYVGLKVRLLFDPPLSSAAVESMNRQISEFEWRLFVAADPVEPTSGKEELQSGA